ncbi:MAG: dihydroxy-acid dehydratase [Gammaproteobacteria bacterium]|nr:dihydroxy-acid dehydratase [Gammaproteobacteria bacterium]MCH9743747.1 dihydroxy-acid dehydratase [Gammaproteobacteria bacterium]
MFKKSKKQLRSASWFAPSGRVGYHNRAWLKTEGMPKDSFDGRPVIGICNSASELTPCNLHLKFVAEAVKRGVWQAGGFPLEFPTISLGETLLRPSSMLFRNLMSMDVEEMIRANPLDGVVLLCGCDKTTPAQLMGAASVDLPSLMISGGPMLNGHYRGRTVGSGTDERKLDAEFRAGNITAEDFLNAESATMRSHGHCNTMGTASTMTNLTEALGMQLPNSAAIPAVDSRRYAYAQVAGRRIVDMVKEDLRPSQILTREAFENAIKINAAIGGSSNAIIHLLAIAGRTGADLHLNDFDELTKDIPLLVNLMPAGEYLMEEFYYAGGLPLVIKELGNLLHQDCITVSGKTLAENVKDAENFNQKVITPLDSPVKDNAPIAVLYGNLCPNGAVIKESAASPELMQHTGRAVVFEDIEEMHAKINSPDLDVDENSILVLKNCGPCGYPGMPEVGDMPVPKKLLDKGIRDIVRISDARMSGTAFGTVVLHVTPESSLGGPLALVENGDEICLDVAGRKLDLKVDEATLQQRREKWVKPDLGITSGYQSLYIQHVQQANLGCDFDFLVGCRGDKIPRESF